MTRRITRKQFLVGAGATSSLALIRAPAVHAARRIVIKLGFDQSSVSPMTHHLIAAGEQIRKATGGELDVQVFPSSALGSDENMLSSVRSGAIQMMGLSDDILSTFIPSAAISNVGYAFKDAKVVYTAFDGGLGDLVREDIVKHGLQPMHAIWSFGYREVTTSTKPIKTPADLHGFKIRVPNSPIMVSIFKSLGAAPATIDFHQVYTALQTHVVDGQEVGLVPLESNNLYEVQKYCSMTNHAWIGCWMLMNNAFWHRLSADHKKAITEAFDAQALKQRSSEAELADSLQGKLTSQGLRFNTPDPAPFRALLVKNGFYTKWKKNFGPELWSVLEKYAGALG